MSFEWGKNLRVQVFGESHAAAVGVVVDGLPAGEALDLEALGRLLARRAPGQGPWATARRESDVPEVLCGLLDGRTTGAPLAALIRNTDRRSADYAAQGAAADRGPAEKTDGAAGQSGAERADTGPEPGAEQAAGASRCIPRPGHSDYPAFVRYGGAADPRGGGAFSGRLTAPLCFAGGAALQILARRGIRVYAHIAGIGGETDTVLDFAAPDEAALAAVAGRPFPVLDEAAGGRMQALIAAARARGDSVGGSIRCFVLGLPAGLGAHMFDGVENRLSAALFGIPGVKAVEFGSGFAGCEGFGSEQNDPFAVRQGRVVTEKNDAGGVLGGSTTGMPLVFRAGLKPTPSIAREQRSVDLLTLQPAGLAVRGRHDPCIVPRAVPAVEAVAALAALDLLLDAPAVLKAPAAL